MQHINQQIQAFVLPENPILLGQASDSHHLSQEKRGFKEPPAGLQMAPCGCFFDPRIYHIEWITNEFPHPSFYKLLEVPRVQSAQNPSLTDIQRYVRDPGPSIPYAHYQQTLKNSQFVLPRGNQEDATNMTKQDNVTNPLQESPHTEILDPQKQGLVQQNEIQLPQLVISVPSSKQNETSLPSSANSCLNERFLPQDQIQLPSLDQSQQGFQRYDSYQEMDTKSTDNYQVTDLILDSKVNIHNGSEQAPVNSPTDSHVSMESVVPQQSNITLPQGSNDVNAPSSRGLPEEVLLEDAMIMFDCIPGNADFGVSNSNSGSNRALYKDAKDEVQVLRSYVSVTGTSSQCKNSLGDISFLNLPDELLSADYSVPEISDALCSMDYFYNMNDFNEELHWDAGLDPNLVESQCQQFTSPDLNGDKTTNISLIKSTNPEPCGGFKNSTSPRCYHVDIHNCLEELANY